MTNNPHQKNTQGRSYGKKPSFRQWPSRQTSIGSNGRTRTRGGAARPDQKRCPNPTEKSGNPYPSRRSYSTPRPDLIKGISTLTVLKVHHRTLYQYRQPVQLGVHRMMVRPRETRDVRLLSHALVISPDAEISWSHDIHGNAVAAAEFPFGNAETLQIDAFAKLELNATAKPLFEIEAPARSYPFSYSDDDFKDLNALLCLQYADPEGQLRGWAHAFVRSHPTDTLALLMDLNSGVSRTINYQAREGEGTQSPTQTLARGWGACRDLAVLFLEAARSLGFGARLVSGYIHDSVHRLIGSQASGTTHAWVEIYVPGAGWITFDPTNAAMGGANLIPVAVGRDIHQVMPVSGSFIGASNAFLSLSVSVKVLPHDDDAAIAPLFVAAEL